MALDKLAYEGLTNAHSRRAFLKKVGIVSGGLMAAGVIGEGLLFGAAAVQAANTDLQTLQFAFTLENVAVAAYKAGAGSGLLSADVVAVGTKFAGQHQEHANAIKAAITSLKGDVPAVPTKINFPAFKTQDDILNFALALESAAVGAYYTAGGGFENRDLAVAAASIVGVESTHVAILNSVLKKDPLPTAFVIGTPFAQVQATANSLLGGGGGQGGAPAPTAAAMPASAPKTGIGGSQSGNDLTGAAVGGLSIMAAAGVAALAVSRKRAQTSTSNEDAE